MNILFIHQNMPDQYKHLAPALARLSAHRVMFLTQRQDVLLPGVARTTYEAPRAVKPETHPYLRLQESAVLHGQQVVRSLIDLRRQGFVPNLVIGHPGWGELLFVRDVYPDVPVLSYAEFYYHGEGADIGFDAADHDKAQDLDVRCRARIRAGHLLQSLESCIQATSPTHWQKSVHPEAYHAKIKVIFDGVDTNLAKPEREAALTLPDGTRIAQGDEVVSYVARNLEPYRGFRSLMPQSHAFSTNDPTPESSSSAAMRLAMARSLRATPTGARRCSPKSRSIETGCISCPGLPMAIS
jgi:hypothetical protein